MLASHAATIHFDRRKYGSHLLADACEIGAIPRFIKTPEPHRLAFYEVALISAGRGTLALDGVPLEIAPGRLCLTEPGEVRSWRVEGARLDGLLAFFEPDLFHEVFADPCFVDRLPIVAAAPAERSFALDRPAFDALAEIVAAMRDELRAPDPDTAHVLRAKTYELLIALQRLSGARARATGERAGTLARRFSALVGERYRHAEALACYADRLGVSVRHLNQCVRAATGLTASETIHQRVHLEARRLLLTTALSVSAIAERLGFSDVPYFIRFFKRRAAQTPGEFRAAHKSPASDRPGPF
jgi:AraC family transcriptional activator of pobA